VIKIVFIMPEGTCKYVPSCSQYAKEAIRKYNVIQAFFKIIIRILKCNPFSKGGIDPA
jgi:putative membrane protein insertion efficiency factor